MLLQDCEMVAGQLRARGISCMHYHADMDPEARQQAHTMWSQGKVRLLCTESTCKTSVCHSLGVTCIFAVAGVLQVQYMLMGSSASCWHGHVLCSAGQVQVIVATIAFGMGINKPDGEL